MPRTFARLKFDMWREGLDGLGPAAKLVYCVVLTEPSLNHAGVGAVRRGSWARHASLSEEQTTKALAELEAGDYVLIDDETEEVLVRTLIRNDGVAEQPLVLKGALTAALQTVSKRLRRRLAEELRKLPPRPPDRVSQTTGRRLVYADPHATADLLDPPPNPPKPSRKPLETLSEDSPKTLETLSKGSGDPIESHSKGTGVGVGVGVGVTSVGTTDLKIGAVRRKSPAKPLPPDWTPNEACRAYAAEQGLNLDHEAEQFRLHAEAKDRRQVRWDAAFRMWLNTATALATTRGRLRVVPDRFDPDDVLGPDMWDPPGAPLDIDTGPRAARDRWYRERIAEHRAEREAKARAVLASRQQPGTA